eukprot:CAMPEP_0117436346 /NCGR_PEP_ID=MMETSP0759-20121206/960_1 /TAXON_ID=63605 /ORGANISM="Percolomonas cosmopolitus, Strain WS" /LENGTH=2722 /DNA_ID=CAMNT_0005227943 /DNA_START=832 /DNA_END=9000 /DNA_ORIENTATION=+
MACAGETNSLILAEDGTLASCGANDMEQIVENGDARYVNPVRVNTVPISDDIVSMACGSCGFAVADAQGNLYLWGSIDAIDIGDTPVQYVVGGGSEMVIEVAMGSDHLLALTSSGNVFCMGRNSQKQLGVGGGPTTFLTEITFFSDKFVEKISAGFHNSAVFTDSHSLYGFGANENSLFGVSGSKIDPTLINLIPQDISYIPRLSYRHWYMILENRHLYGVGHNGESQARGFAGSNTGWVAFDTDGMLDGHRIWRAATVSDGGYFIQLTCYDISATHDEVCFSRGDCISLDDCQCNAGYGGDECEHAYCYGILASNSSVCSTHGTCVEVNQCNCDLYHHGARCELNECFSILSNDSLVCSSHGTCDAHNECNCATDFYGAECSNVDCFGVLSNSTEVCSSQGTCTAPHNCSCNPGYTGSECEIPICFGFQSTDTSNVCKGHGTCVAKNNCDCDPGYSGDSCELITCFGFVSNDSQSCSSNGICSSSDVCDCNSMYGGLNCEFPECFGILSNESTACSSSGACVAPNNCNCSLGFVGSVCELRNCFGIASNESHVCSGNGACSSPDHCTCSSNFVGAECDIPVCFGLNATHPLACSDRGTCVAPNECLCDTHYVDLECNVTHCNGILSNSSTVCSGQGDCVEYQDCMCATGFGGEDCQYPFCHGLLANDSNICSQHGSCLAPDVCSCTSGYIHDQCQTPMCFGIEANSSLVCSSLRGSCILPETCICNSHFGGEECQWNNCYGSLSNETTVCTGRGNCTTAGTCTCENGYAGLECEHPICWGLLSNDSQVCNTHGVCNCPNQCSCYPGYAGLQCDLSICNGKLSNETDVCSGFGECTAPEHCNCEWGYHGHDCHVSLCNGYLSNDSQVCSTYGHCIEPALCECFDGHAGEWCEHYICQGLWSNDTLNVCDGHGTCDAPELCHCLAGYTGSACELNICFSRVSNESDVCSSHGECVLPDKCSCFEGYYGSECETADCFGHLSNSSLVCSSHGVCELCNSCNCTGGYFGEACSNYSCFGVSFDEESVCSERGNCLGYNFCNCTRSHSLGDNCEECELGWYGAFCDIHSHVISVLSPQVQVIGTCDNLHLDGSASYSEDNSIITHYMWSCGNCAVNSTISNFLDAQKHPYITLPSEMLAEGEHEFTLRVRTSTGVSLPRSVSVYKYNTSIALASVMGSRTKYVYASSSFDLIGLFADPCGGAIIEYAQWHQISGDSLISWFEPVSTLDRGFDNALRFANGFPREVGMYEFDFAIKTLGAQHTSRIQVAIEVGIRDLVALLNDSYRSSVQYTPIYLSADLSFDPEVNTPGEDIFTLNCTILHTGDLCTDKITAVTTRNWILTPDVAGDWHVELIYTKGNRSSSHSVVYTVETLTAQVYTPTISIQSMSRVNLNDKVTLQGVLASDDPRSVDVIFQWSSPDMVLDDDTLLSKTTGLTLVIRPYMLPQAITRFRLMGTHTNGRQAFATISIRLNSPPISTSLNSKMVISPTEGSVLNTQFLCAFSEWADVDHPLMYRLFYVHPITQETQLLVPFTESSHMNFQIPQPGCADEDFKITIVGGVKDSLGAETFVNRTITVTPISFLDAKGWIEFALKYMPPDFSLPPTDLWSFEPSLVKVVNNVASLVCANCTSPIIVASVCISQEDCLANRLYDDTSYQEYQVRALDTLKRKLIAPTNDELVLVVDSLSCMAKTGNFSDEFLLKAPQFLWNLTMSNRMPLVSLPSLVEVLSVLTEAIFQHHHPHELRTTYNCLLDVLYETQHQYVEYFSPGETIDGIISKNFEFSVVRGYSSSFREFPKIRQQRQTMRLNSEENIDLGSWTISPEPTKQADLHSIVDSIFTRYSFSPYYHNPRTSASLTDTHRFEMRLNGELLDGSIHDPSVLSLPYTSGIDIRDSSSNIKETFREMKCLVWERDQDEWIDQTCLFYLVDGSGVCSCRVSTSDVAVFSIARDIFVEPDTSAMLVLMLLNIPVLFFTCCSTFLCFACIILRREKRKQLKEARQSVAMRFKETSLALLALNAVRATEKEKTRQLMDDLYESAVKLLGDGLVDDAVLKFSRAGDMGHKPSHIALGKLYLCGSVNILQDIDRAAFHFQCAEVSPEGYLHLVPAIFSNNWDGLVKGHSESYLTVSKFYLTNNNDKDVSMALHFMHLAVEKGSREACCIMAKFYREGFGHEIRADINKSVELYQKASDLGEGTAMYNLALIYSSDSFGLQDHERAMKWLKKAARLGVDAAKDRLKAIQFSQELNTLKERAEKNDPLAVLALVKLYLKGKHVKSASDERKCLMEANLHKSYEYLQQGASLGDPGCKVYLGNMYRRGYLVEQDLERTHKLYTEALPHPVAHFNLGLMYERGNPKYNLEKALNHFWIALNGGINQSRIAIDRITSERYRLHLLNCRIFRRFAVKKRLAVNRCTFVEKSLDSYGSEGKQILRDAIEITIGDDFVVNSEDSDAESERSNTPASSHTLMKQAISQFGSKNFRACFELLHEVRKVEPSHKRDAYYLLGVLRAHGKGVTKNAEYAFKYFKRAASLGHARASFECGKILLESSHTLTKQSEKIKVAFHLFESAASKGDVKAQAILAVLYWRGFKTEKDIEKARKYAELSSSKSARSCNVLGEIYESVQQEETALRYYHRAAKMGNVSGMKRCSGLLCKMAHFDEAIHMLEKGKAVVGNSDLTMEIDLQSRIEHIQKAKEKSNDADAELWEKQCSGEHTEAKDATMLQKIFGDDIL